MTPCEAMAALETKMGTLLLGLLKRTRAQVS